LTVGRVTTHIATNIDEILDIISIPQSILFHVGYTSIHGALDKFNVGCNFSTDEFRAT
jgi:hypothetical protein